MSIGHPEADLAWYLGISRRRQTTPRCPFASVDRCPRYFHSVFLLGKAGFTRLPEAEVQRLDDLWNKSDVLPLSEEELTSTSGTNGHTHTFSNFCPEVTGERFGFFASVLCDFADEIDRDAAQKTLLRDYVPISSWRWRWAAISAQHFTECQLYSLLLHSQSRQSGAAAKVEEVADLVTLKPGFWGMNVDLKEAWRRCRSFWKGKYGKNHMDA